MGTLYKIGEINNVHCDSSIKNYFLDSVDRIIGELEEKNKITEISQLHNEIISSTKYLQIRKIIVENQKELSERYRSFEQTYTENELALNLIELFSDYYISLPPSAMCDLMSYIFYDVYCTKKNIKNFNGYAKYKDFNSGGQTCNWYCDPVFKGIEDTTFYQINSDKFWSNFSNEIISKIGNVQFLLICHGFDFGKKMLKISNNKFFIIDIFRWQDPYEPWDGELSRILYAHDDFAKDLNGNYFQNNFFDQIEKTQRQTHGVTYALLQKLKDLGISTKSILNGTVSKTKKPFYSDEFEVGDFSTSNTWSCSICGGDEDSGCLYFDQSECPKIT
jgi:hypothetical protein